MTTGTRSGLPKAGYAFRNIFTVGCPLLLAACGGTEEDREPAPASVTEGIVYSTIRPGSLDIYLFEDTLRGPTRLTDHPALDYNPTFSPDGAWLVFTSERSGNPDLWALRLDGAAAPIQLTNDTGLDDAADFSPDGSRLVFVSTRHGNADIFMMPFQPGDASAASDAQNLSRREGGDFNPTFSPDGRWIAYSRQDKLWPTTSAEDPSFDANGTGLYIMAADGTSPRELVGRAPGPEVETGVPYGSVAGSPAWDTDGTAIFYYRVSRSGREIRSIRPDGSGDRRVASEGLSPAVGPNGRIVFSRPDLGRGLDALTVLTTGRLVSVARDGSDERFESRPGDDFFAPAFDPTGGRLAAHGPGPIDDHAGTMADGSLFAPLGARTSTTLPDREVVTWGVRGFFPALTARGEVISTTLDDGALSRTAPDGSARETIHVADGFAWGASVARDAGILTVAVGSPFAPGSEEVDIWTMPLDGGPPRNLTDAVSANDALPHPSSDGRRVVFRTGGDGGVGRIVVMDASGENRRRITGFDAAETMPAFSPDGEWVVFTTNRVGGWKLWIQRLDGSEGRFLEPSRLDIPDTSMHPRFSPDGAWVVFTSDRGGFNDEWPLTPFPQPNGDLWAVSVEDGSTVRLIHNKWEDGPNDWGPLRIGG